MPYVSVSAVGRHFPGILSHAAPLPPHPASLAHAWCSASWSRSGIPPSPPTEPQSVIFLCVSTALSVGSSEPSLWNPYIILTLKKIFKLLIHFFLPHFPPFSFYPHSVLIWFFITLLIFIFYSPEILNSARASQIQVGIAAGGVCAPRQAHRTHPCLLPQGPGCPWAPPSKVRLKLWPQSLGSGALQVGFSDARGRLRASFSVLQRKAVKESLTEINSNHLGSA